MCRPEGGRWLTRNPTTSTARASTRPRRCSPRSSWRRASRIGHENARAGHRQLRLIHVQPRPVPGRAGCRPGRGSQRPRRGQRPAGKPPRAAGDLSGAVHADRGRNLGRGLEGVSGGRDSDAGGLPGPPVDGRGVWGAHRARRAGARQGRGGRARRPGRAGRAGEPDPRRPLPLAGRRPGSARRAGAHRVVRGRRHGGPTPRAAGRGSAVSPRVGTHPAGQGNVAELPHLMPNELLTRAIDEVCSGTHLTADHASAVLDEIMEGRSSDVETGAFLIALRAKGETVAEIVGLARTMRRLAAHVEAGRDDLVDTAGTGGGPSTFNISTTAALVAAGAGCAVAKHGNRSSTSRSGSADLLEALGVRIDQTPEQVADSIRDTGFGFMFAPAHHAAMKHVMPTRKELAVRTIFNFLGPLTNPAGATRQLLGVSDRRYQETIAEALGGLGCDPALVVAGDDGLDELTIHGPTRVIEVRDGHTNEWFVSPGDVGLAEAPLESITGGDPEQNAEVVRRVLAGEPGPALDISLLNAGAAIYAGAGCDDLASGVASARTAVESGAALGVLERLVAAGTDR